MLLNEIGAPVNGITALMASPDAPDEDLEPGTWTRAYKTLPPVFVALDVMDGKTLFTLNGFWGERADRAARLQRRAATVEIPRQARNDGFGGRKRRQAVRLPYNLAADDLKMIYFLHAQTLRPHPTLHRPKWRDVHVGIP